MKKLTRDVLQQLIDGSADAVARWIDQYHIKPLDVADRDPEAGLGYICGWAKPDMAWENQEAFILTPVPPAE